MPLLSKRSWWGAFSSKRREESSHAQCNVQGPEPSTLAQIATEENVSKELEYVDAADDHGLTSALQNVSIMAIGPDKMQTSYSRQGQDSDRCKGSDVAGAPGPSQHGSVACTSRRHIRERADTMPCEAAEQTHTQLPACLYYAMPEPDGGLFAPALKAHAASQTTPSLRTHGRGRAVVQHRLEPESQDCRRRASAAISPLHAAPALSLRGDEKDGTMPLLQRPTRTLMRAAGAESGPRCAAGVKGPGVVSFPAVSSSNPSKATVAGTALVPPAQCCGKGPWTPEAVTLVGSGPEPRSGVSARTPVPQLAGEGMEERASVFRELDESWPRLQSAYDAELAAVADSAKDIARMKRHLQEQLDKRERCRTAEYAAAGLRSAETTWLDILRRRTELTQHFAGVLAPGLQPRAPRTAVEQEVAAAIDVLSESESGVSVGDAGRSGEHGAGLRSVGSDGVLDLLSSSEEGAEGPAAEVAEAAAEASGAETEESEEEAEGFVDLDVPERRLSPSLMHAYEGLLVKPHCTDVLARHEASNVEIGWSDFHTFAPGGWLSDPCVNMYMSLLQDRDTDWFFEPELVRAKCLFMSSHFVAKLCQEAGGYKYSNVRRWTTARKFKNLGIPHYTSIADFDKIIIPVHLGNHWTCAVLNVRDTRLEYYDSLGGAGCRRSINALQRWLEDDFQDKRGEAPPSQYRATQWAVVINPAGTPCQQNGHDCGVFAIMCANYCAADRAFDYGQREIHSFYRAVCALECYSKRLRMLDS